MQSRYPNVVVIAATDSSNGAGLTADLSVCKDFEVRGLGVVTAVTAQNFKEVTDVTPVKTKSFKAQLASILEEVENIDVIKIGLIPNKKILKQILKFLSKPELGNTKVVWDPVAVASVGQALTKVDFKEKLAKILPFVDVFTPNLDEAQLLSEQKVDFSSLNSYLESLESISGFFRKLGAKNVLIKGGHLDKYSNLLGADIPRNYYIDALYTESDTTPFYFLANKTKRSSNSSFNKSATNNTTKHSNQSHINVHGTGCILSSAIASLLSLDYNVEDSFAYAKAYLTQGFEEAYDYHSNCYYFKHTPYKFETKYFPSMAKSIDEIKYFGFSEDDEGFDSCPKNLGLYPVVDSSAWIERLCKANVKTMQLRIKDSSDLKKLESEIKKAVSLGKKYKAQVFIDDHWELAIKHKAYGVHLGQSDLVTANLRELKLAGVRLGVSTHGFAEIGRALLLKPSYVALGHIFPTNSKVMPSAPQGVKRLHQYVSLLQDYPTVAIGGIKLTNVNDVLDTGVGSIAMITAITLAEDPEAAIKVWQDTLSAKGIN